MNKKLILMSLTVLTQLVVTGERSGSSNDLVDLISNSWSCSQTSVEEIISIIENPHFDPNIPGGICPFRQYPLGAALDALLDPKKQLPLLDQSYGKWQSSDYSRIILALIHLPRIDLNLTTGDQPPIFKVVQVTRQDGVRGQQILNSFLDHPRIDILAKGLHNSTFKRAADRAVELGLQGPQISRLRQKTEEQLTARREALLSEGLPAELVYLITEEFL